MDHLTQSLRQLYKWDGITFFLFAFNSFKILHRLFFYGITVLKLFVAQSIL